MFKSLIGYSKKNIKINLKDYKTSCLNLKNAEETMPFDKSTLVFSIVGKMFSSTNLETFEFFNVKCEPEKASPLSEKYHAVTPSYYMNKKHWNSIKMDGSISDRQIKKWIEDSYNLVVAKLPKKVQKEVESTNEQLLIATKI
jgi:predicted DNA-binding protein (MmcQ/YjbR family)